jgi:gliding motility-associated-like protein
MKFLFIILLVCLKLSVNAAHTKGGYLFYEYLGVGATANTAKYKVTMKVYMDVSSSSAQITPPNGVSFSFFDRDNSSFLFTRSLSIVSNNNISNCVLQACYPCFSSVPQISYKIITYEEIVEFPLNQKGYTVSYIRCCRLGGIINIQNSGDVGGTWTIDIPGQVLGQQEYKNNSAKFFNNDTTIVCRNNSFTMPFNAFDPDGDSLTYEFVSAYEGGSTSNSAPTQASFPPYGSVPYNSSFSGTSPLGPNVFINRQTGIISGTAPSSIGEYVIAVLVSEYKNGVKIGEVRKEIHLKIGDCNSVNAELTFNTVTCDGFTHSFINAAGNPGGLITSYFWDFGVLNQTNDTSNLENPSFTFPDTGVYIIKLIVNKFGACKDSISRPFGVYPGFFPNFNSTGVCYNSPIQFTDASTTNYGVINSWSWNFGDAAVLSDTSHLQNPTYQYPNSGSKPVQLIVTNSKGCIDTVTKNIALIDKPIIDLPFKDTLICSIDTLQLFSSFSSGNPSWQPNYRIINPNSNNPFVYPLVTTSYIVTANDQGCIQSDTVVVNVKDFVTVNVMPDTAICLTDAIIIRTQSDALSYVWTPAATLNNPTIKEPTATPVAAVTKYYVSANIGKCQSADSVTIVASPYPIVKAWGDTTICFNGTAFLYGTASGDTYNWSPVNGLINANTLTPIARPARTTAYILTTQGAIGCPKPAFDTVLITVVPPIIANAGADTTIVAGQPLQLNATGSVNYQWFPSTYLNNSAINNPIAILPINASYAVKVSDNNGCFDYDTIKITVFQTAPEIFVPTIFTPNGDGVNDVLVPIAVGFKQFDYFAVYNRYGQQVFFTKQLRQGWNGIYKNKEQGIDTYVWQVQGTDYTGKKVFKKGTVVLAK